MERKSKYFDPQLPATFRFLAEAKIEEARQRLLFMVR
jgi:hypothetical protein